MKKVHALDHAVEQQFKNNIIPNKKILLTNAPGIGSLSEFIDILSLIQKEYFLQTVEIGSIADNNRNRSAKLQGELAVLELDYDYNFEKFYIKIIHNKDKETEVKDLFNRIKTIVENPKQYL